MSLSRPTTLQPSFASERAQSDPISPPDPVMSTFLFDDDILSNIARRRGQARYNADSTHPLRRPHDEPQRISHRDGLFHAGAPAPARNSLRRRGLQTLR